ncbi:hypothetical protein BSKO_02072 [Bryopsis sp. KO-2023]|nr:hypothetical protein BSKO_02072 [Bryopsis sp. KO-2023]
MSGGFDPIASGIQQCPFLHRLASTQGESYARNIAVNPSRPASTGGRRPIFEELENFTRTFKLFHGPGGVVPLANKSGRATTSDVVAPVSSEKAKRDWNGSKAAPAPRTARGLSPLVVAPAASMSMSNFGFLNGLGDFLSGRGGGSHKKPENNSSRGKGGGGNSKGRIKASAAGLSAAAAGAASNAGKCPLRKYFGPMATMVMTGRYKCPPVVVKMRAMLSRTQVVKSLRPEGLPVKILAVMAVSSALNIPFGVLRAHCKKFSPEWFLVVHATIPFIAMFRKAVVLPQYALIFTVAAAVGGQMVGSRAEKKRMLISEKAKAEDVPSVDNLDALAGKSPDNRKLSEWNDASGARYVCAPQAMVADAGVGKACGDAGGVAVM